MMRIAGIRFFRLLLSLTIFAIAFLFACTPESCYEETESAVRAGFYETGTGRNIAADSVTVFGLGRDTLYFNSKGEKSILLPLNPAETSCTFVLILNGVSDTLTMVYSSYLHLISKECGYSVFHTLESYSASLNLVDTIIIQNENIKIPNDENIRIFF
jgi:hypothetical protein